MSYTKKHLEQFLREKHGDGILEDVKNWVKTSYNAGKNYVRENKLLSRGLRGISSLAPNKIASSVVDSLAERVEKAGYGKTTRRRKGMGRTKLTKLEVGILP